MMRVAMEIAAVPAGLLVRDEARRSGAAMPGRLFFARLRSLLSTSLFEQADGASDQTTDPLVAFVSITPTALNGQIFKC